MSQAACEFRGNVYRKGAKLAMWSQRQEEAPLDPALPILDPHHHVWDDQRGRYLIHELAADVAASGHNVVATLFVEATAMYRAQGPAEMQAVGEIEFANGVAAMSEIGRAHV